jgi:hypothetical protein
MRVRWRRVAALALLVVVAGALLIGARGPAGASVPRAEEAVVVVGPGETVWDLVAPHVPEGVDRAVYAAEVVAANDLDPQRITPGTAVRLP